MSSHLEVFKPSGRELVPLTGERVTLGKASTNAVALEHDPTVSRLHAILENHGSAWSIRDMGSRNGTFVNGEKIAAERVLRSGDEVRIGKSRVVYLQARERGEPIEEATIVPDAAQLPPRLTRREIDVLMVLCRPLVSDDPFPEPASVRRMAGELFVTEAAVKQHLQNLYDKFAIPTEGDRRVRLANEALRRGAVTIAQLRDSATEVERLDGGHRTFMAGPVGAPDGVDGRVDRGDHLAVHRGVDRRLRRPLPVAMSYISTVASTRVGSSPPTATIRPSTSAAPKLPAESACPCSFSQVPDSGSNRSKAAKFSSAVNAPATHRVHVDAVRQCGQMFTRGRQVGARVQDSPSNTSVCGTSCLSFCPPTTMSLSSTTAAAGAARAYWRLGSSSHFPLRNAKTLFDASATVRWHHR